MNSVVLIVVYFGKWPRWFEAFLISCKANASIDWLIFTDCPRPANAPANVQFVSSTMPEFTQRVFEKTGTKAPLVNFRKLCDFKPAYGHLFDEYIKKYDFWGFCDVDIIWGNIRKFVTPELLNKYDLITALENTIAGHFTIIRNTEKGRLLYRHDQKFEKYFVVREYQWFDERVFPEIIHELANRDQIEVCWDKNILDIGIEPIAHQDYYLDRWYYDSGALFHLTSSGQRLKEYMYLHFISWKTYMKCNALDKVDRFYISFNGIHEFPSSNLLKFLNLIRRAVWGFPHRKRFNLWKRGTVRRWERRLERWRLCSPKVEV